MITKIKETLSTIGVAISNTPIPRAGSVSLDIETLRQMDDCKDVVNDIASPWHPMFGFCEDTPSKLWMLCSGKSNVSDYDTKYTCSHTFKTRNGFVNFIKLTEIEEVGLREE